VPPRGRRLRDAGGRVIESERSGAGAAPVIRAARTVALVRAGPTVLLVRAGAAVERVGPVAAVQTVVPGPTRERVVPPAAADRVVAAATVDHIVAPATDDDVMPRGPVKVVRPRCADDGGGLSVAGGGPRGSQGRMRQDQRGQCRCGDRDGTHPSHDRCPNHHALLGGPPLGTSPG